MRNIRWLAWFNFILISLMALAVAACHQSPPMSVSECHDLTPYQKSVVSDLRHSGVQVVKQGAVLQIVIPTDKFFRSQTTKLRRSRVEAIESVAALVKSYIASYRHPRIRVSGYTDTVFSRASRIELSAQYAKVVAAYLWNNGVPERWVRVKGYGARYPIATNRTPVGAAFNRRVVVRIN